MQVCAVRWCGPYVLSYGECTFGRTIFFTSQVSRSRVQDSTRHVVVHVQLHHQHIVLHTTPTPDHEGQGEGEHDHEACPSHLLDGCCADEFRRLCALDRRQGGQGGHASQHGWFGAHLLLETRPLARQHASLFACTSHPRSDSILRRFRFVRRRFRTHLPGHALGLHTWPLVGLHLLLGRDADAAKRRHGARHLRCVDVEQTAAKRPPTTAQTPPSV